MSVSTSFFLFPLSLHLVVFSRPSSFKRLFSLCPMVFVPLHLCTYCAKHWHSVLLSLIENPFSCLSSRVFLDFHSFPDKNSLYFFNFMGLTNTTAIMLSALTICQAFLSAVVSVTFFLYYSNCALVIFFLLEYRLLEDRIQV